MRRFVPILFIASAVIAAGGAATAQSKLQPPVQTPGVSVPGFTAEDPRPGTSGGSPASSGSNVGSNIGAGATAAPVGNDVTPPGAAPDVAQSPKTPSLFGLSREIPVR